MFELEDRYWWFVARRSLALGLLERFGCLDRNATLLDIGCGTGVVLDQLQKRSHAIGFDFSEHALDYSGRRGLPNLVRGDAHALPFANDSVDAVVGLDIFEHLKDDVGAFAEAFRALKPGGTLVLSVPAFMALWGPHDVALMHFRRYRAKEMRDKLRSVGFEVPLLSYSVFLLFPLVAIIRFFEKRKAGPAHASLPTLPAWLNRTLIGLQKFEQKLLSAVPLPWGSSVVAVARKPLR